MKYCTVAMIRDRPISVEVNGCVRFACALRPIESIKSGRHILESRCADRCANNTFLTSFRATLNKN